MFRFQRQKLSLQRCFHHGLRRGFHLQRFARLPQMLFDRGSGQPHDRRHILSGFAFTDPLQSLTLTLCKPLLRHRNGQGGKF